MMQSLCIGGLNFCRSNVPIFYLNPCYMSEHTSRITPSWNKWIVLGTNPYSQPDREKGWPSFYLPKQHCSVFRKLLLAKRPLTWLPRVRKKSGKKIFFKVWEKSGNLDFIQGKWILWKKSGKSDLGLGKLGFYELGICRRPIPSYPSAITV